MATRPAGMGCAWGPPSAGRGATDARDEIAAIERDRASRADRTPTGVGVRTAATRPAGAWRPPWRPPLRVPPAHSHGPAAHTHGVPGPPSLWRGPPRGAVSRGAEPRTVVLARVVAVGSRLHLPGSRGVSVDFDFDDPQRERGSRADRGSRRAPRGSARWRPTSCTWCSGSRTSCRASRWTLALALVFPAWRRTEHTLSIHRIDMPRRELFCWATVMATFALGTSLSLPRASRARWP
jgi:hypothetical protein